ncbi:ornithine decarboxylase 1-related [Anaeramoeba ignava]|uniref:Ornithine decarboxylase 1-related n=1 Tax=Anaeramoeba ignava TaxID=1746090 RepID=A0A9Q0R955_ANAIG|nr:ornithine decarboxylase 1-related [Anaeramoeba ignava]
MLYQDFEVSEFIQMSPDEQKIIRTKQFNNYDTHSAVNHAIKTKIEAEQDQPFVIIDLDEVVRRYEDWMRWMPTIKPFYAVKCNPNIEILKVLAKLDVNFDCASKQEIAVVLGLGVSSDRIIFANPCKMIPHLKYAKAHKVSKMTFDSVEEMVKISKHYPEAELVLRIKTNDENSVCRLSSKFGADLKEIHGILTRAVEIGVNIIGVSFHVGSGCKDVATYTETLTSVSDIFRLAKDMGIHMNFLDIGGGFPGTGTFHKQDGVTFMEIAETVNQDISELFDSDVEVVAEPGRYFATSCQTIVLDVYAKRKKNHGETDTFQYFLSDGLYGTLNCVIFDHAEPAVSVFRSVNEDEELYESSLFGPTCDSIDCIKKSLLLPELDIGDWIIFYDMGAYTTAAATNFNGFQITDVTYLQSSHYI